MEELLRKDTGIKILSSEVDAWQKLKQKICSRHEV